MDNKIPVIKRSVTKDQAQYLKNTLEGDIIKARRKMFSYFLEKVIQRHFEPGNQGRYKYKDVSPEYKKWKLTHGKGNVLLVLSGKLKKLAKEGKITDKTIVWDFPSYGLYQLNIRPFLTPSPDEKKELELVFRKELNKIRKKRVKELH